MARKTTNSKAAPKPAAQVPVGNEQLVADAAITSVASASPSGESASDGTNTVSEESGGAAWSGSTDPEIPQGDVLASGQDTAPTPEGAASPSGTVAADPAAQGLSSLFFDLTRTPTEDEWRAFEILVRHMRIHSVVNRSPSAIEQEAFELLAARDPGVSAIDMSSRVADPDTDQPWMLRIRSKVDGFRRAGVVHSKEPAEIALSTFTSDQVQTLLAEPNLTVELV